MYLFRFAFVLLCITSVYQNSCAQKVTVSDIETLFNNTDKGAERFTNKGFDVHIDRKYGELDFEINDGKESISIELTEAGDYSNRYIRSCYSKKYHLDFEKFKQFIVQHGKKVDFYQSRYYDSYYTVYFYNFMYYHFGKGVCTNEDKTYKFDSFFVINMDHKF
ncbi:hypothetical protein SIO70_11665 [Chitinophaga sancti]|uniref:hypothetical protein n=1 Tax=Chitinophaga sancti TaxID=1004 RepID=UPI002A753146|nr:hypothetical protein [Chitinophaga sancti]WPQ65505.1 hypothetical protein SIO70_11665 [Chitinophaga sancti]